MHPIPFSVIVFIYLFIFFGCRRLLNPNIQVFNIIAKKFECMHAIENRYIVVI